MAAVSDALLKIDQACTKWKTNFDSALELYMNRTINQKTLCVCLTTIALEQKVLNTRKDQTTRQFHRCQSSIISLNHSICAGLASRSSIKKTFLTALGLKELTKFAFSSFLTIDQEMLRQIGNYLSTKDYSNLRNSCTWTQKELPIDVFLFLQKHLKTSNKVSKKGHRFLSQSYQSTRRYAKLFSTPTSNNPPSHPFRGGAARDVTLKKTIFYGSTSLFASLIKNPEAKTLISQCDIFLLSKQEDHKNTIYSLWEAFSNPSHIPNPTTQIELDHLKARLDHQHMLLPLIKEVHAFIQNIHPQAHIYTRHPTPKESIAAMMKELHQKISATRVLDDSNPDKVKKSKAYAILQSLYQPEPHDFKIQLRHMRKTLNELAFILDKEPEMLIQELYLHVAQSENALQFETIQGDPLLPTQINQELLGQMLFFIKPENDTYEIKTPTFRHQFTSTSPLLLSSLETMILLTSYIDKCCPMAPWSIRDEPVEQE